MKIYTIALVVSLCIGSIVKAQGVDVFGNKIPEKKSTSVKTNNSEINKKDARGLKQGYWEKKYENGNTAYTVTFKDDKPVGKMIRFYENGNKQVEIDYDNKGEYGDVKIFSEHEKLTATGVYWGTKKDSVWEYFSPEGKKYGIDHFNKGVKNGVSVYFYETGKTAEEVEWKKDVKDGIWNKYHENGNIKSRSFHKNGKIEGPYSIYFKDGTINIQGQFKDGMEDGTWLVFNPDGSLNYKIEYKEGKVLNEDMFDKNQKSMFKEFEENKDKLKDPEEFQHNPDELIH